MLWVTLQASTLWVNQMKSAKNLSSPCERLIAWMLCAMITFLPPTLSSRIDKMEIIMISSWRFSTIWWKGSIKSIKENNYPFIGNFSYRWLIFFSKWRTNHRWISTQIAQNKEIKGTMKKLDNILIIWLDENFQKIPGFIVANRFKASI
jgi:hypothetical protein